MKKLADHIYVVDNFLSHSACDELIAKSEKMAMKKDIVLKCTKMEAIAEMPWKQVNIAF